MSVYQRKYKVTTKYGRIEVRTQKFYTIEIRDPATKKIIRRKGPRDLKSAKVAEARLIQSIERGIAGIEDPFKDFRSLPIQDSIDGFIAKLEGDNCNPKYIYMTRKRLERFTLEAGVKALFDLTEPAWERWRNKTIKAGWNGRPTGHKTINQYLASINQFCDWCVRGGRIPSNPLVKVESSKVDPNDDFRRAMTVEEFEAFSKAIPDDYTRRFYIFIAYTALRRSSIARLQWGDMHLDPDDAHLILRGAINKSRKTQRFPLRRDVAAMMLDARDGAKDTTQVFPRVPKMAEHRRYLKAAGIQYMDAEGKNRLDLHAFRKTLHTWLEDAGVDVREASKALGHLHLSTTMKSYREKRHGRPDAGVEKLKALLPAAPARADNGTLTPAKPAARKKGAK